MGVRQNIDMVHKLKVFSCSELEFSYCILNKQVKIINLDTKKIEWSAFTLKDFESYFKNPNLYNHWVVIKDDKIIYCGLFNE